MSYAPIPMSYAPILMLDASILMLCTPILKSCGVILMLDAPILMSCGVILMLDAPIPTSYAPILMLYSPIPTSDKRVPREKGRVQVVEAVMRAAMIEMWREWRGTFCEWVPVLNGCIYFTRFLKGRQGSIGKR